jgi:hypothetical protein
MIIGRMYIKRLRLFGLTGTTEKKSKSSESIPSPKN